MQLQDTKLQNLINQFDSFSIEELIDIKSNIENKIEMLKKSSEDRLIEDALLYLDRCCNGAATEDGEGFNMVDAHFGKNLARVIRTNPEKFTYRMARKALDMLRKYQNTQLKPVGIKLPKWEAVEHLYGDSNRQALDNSKPNKVFLHGTKIAISFPYDKEIIELCRSIDGRSFDGKNKFWIFPMSSLSKIKTSFPAPVWEWDEHIEVYRLLLEQQKLEKEQELERKALEDAEKISSLIDLSNLNDVLPNGWILRDYQKDGVKFLLSNTKEAGLYDGCILADDQGLGKTVQSLIAAKTLQDKYDVSIFVICPVSLIKNWQKEANLFGVKIETFSNHHKSIPLPLENRKYILICDEAHAFQNPKSKRTKSIENLVTNSNCFAGWFLTATPLKNGRPINLFPLLKFINHEVSKDQWQYKQRYCAATKTRFGWDFNGASHLDELSKKISDAMLRRTKDKVLKELPTKTTIVSQVNLSASQQKAFNKKLKDLLKDYQDRVDSGECDGAAEALVTLGHIRKTSSEFKVDATLELAQSLLDGDNSVVIFTDFLEPAKLLHDKLGGELLTGESKAEDRQAMVDRFQSGESKVFISTIKAGGVGITLTASSNLIMHDRTWTPGDVYQACDRIYRIGQVNPVTITWQQLDCDLFLDDLIAEKQKRIDKVLAGKAKTMRGLGKSRKELALEILAKIQEQTKK